MALPSLASLKRRQRQLDTLRAMLAGVDDILRAVETLSQDRPLTTDEESEAAAIGIRRERILKSIEETADLVGASTGGRRG